MIILDGTEVKVEHFPRWDTAHRFGESSKYGMEKYT